MSHQALETNAVSLSPWMEAAVIKYGWIWVGVGFGFAAKYGLLMKRGKPVTVGMVVADMLLIGMVALIAFNIIVKLGLHGEASALVTSLVAVGADRGIRMLTIPGIGPITATAIAADVLPRIPAIGKLARQMDELLPDLGPPGWASSSSCRQRRAMCR